jgi:hypothetical protein
MAATCGRSRKVIGYLQGGAEVAPNASRRMMNSEVVHTEGWDVTRYPGSRKESHGGQDDRPATTIQRYGYTPWSA